MLNIAVVIVCHCKRVTSRRIEAEVGLGADSVDEIGRRCGAGTGCGGCIPLIETILQGHQTVTAEAQDVLREVAVSFAAS